MPSLGGLAKYLGLFSLGKGFVDKVILQRLLVGAAGIVALAVIAAILAGTILISLLGLLYYALLSYTQIGQVSALAIIGIIVIALIAFIVYKIIGFSKKIASSSSLLFQTSLPASPLSPVTDVVNAFINGLKEPHPAQPATDKVKKYPKSIK